MSESTHTLARLPNGAVKAFPNGHPVLAADDTEIVDGSALDDHGNPVATVYPDPEAPAEAQTAAGYDPLTKAALVSEIGRRNEARPADDQLSAAGNKPDLVAELERADREAAATAEAARQLSIPNPDNTPEA